MTRRSDCLMILAAIVLMTAVAAIAIAPPRDAGPTVSASPTGPQAVVHIRRVTP